MLKCTVKDIQLAQGALRSLLQERLPIKAKYAVSKLARACDSEIEEFYKLRSKTLVEKGLSTKQTATPQGVMEEFTHEDPAVLAATLKEVDDALQAMEVELNALPLKLDQFGTAEIQGHFYGLEWAMVDEEPKA